MYFFRMKSLWWVHSYRIALPFVDMTEALGKNEVCDIWGAPHAHLTD